LPLPPIELDGSNRMGATFGGMLISGLKAGKDAIKLLDSWKIEDGEVVGLAAEQSVDA
jgi:thiamine thiazole synthase